MTILDAALPAFLGDLAGDAEVAAEIDGLAQLAAMLRVEAALADVEAELGLIPSDAPPAIARAAERLAGDLDPGELAAAAARDGVVVPELVRRLRAAAGSAGDYVHHGATSQDIVDSAWACCLSRALCVMEARVQRIGDALADLAETHRVTPTLARTRMQQAAPTSFGLKAAQWLAPLIAHRRALSRLRAAELCVSLGGAAGTQAALGERARAVEEGLAARLGLAVAPLPWHVRREGMVAIGATLASCAASAGKTAQDLLLMGQNEVGEVSFADAGGSSAMAHKRNPVRAEAVLALARHAGAQQAALQAAALPIHERDGAAWLQEQLAWGPLLLAVGAALAGAERMLETLEVHADRLRANLKAAPEPVRAGGAGEATAMIDRTLAAWRAG
ncbi:MAG: lyase family protein [Marivibrio sp.]|uniref:lyase family protein n=1 Tax=Marivibrio sp. TaxID=2039719 RepID=UPI0032F03F9B